jgi:hypothetical protein
MSSFHLVNISSSSFQIPQLIQKCPSSAQPLAQNSWRKIFCAKKIAPSYLLYFSMLAKDLSLRPCNLTPQTQFL